MQDFLREGLLFFFERRFEEEGSKGDEGAEEDEGGAFEGPFEFLPGEVEGEGEETEDDAVDHAGDADGFVVAEDALGVDGVKEEGEAV